jgi:hypothetical protein
MAAIPLKQAFEEMLNTSTELSERSLESVESMREVLGVASLAAAIRALALATWGLTRPTIQKGEE